MRFDSEQGNTDDAYGTLIEEYLKFMTVRRDTPSSILMQPRCVLRLFVTQHIIVYKR